MTNPDLHPDDQPPAPTRNGPRWWLVAILAFVVVFGALITYILINVVDPAEDGAESPTALAGQVQRILVARDEPGLASLVRPESTADAAATAVTRTLDVTGARTFTVTANGDVINVSASAVTGQPLCAQWTTTHLNGKYYLANIPALTTQACQNSATTGA